MFRNTLFLKLKFQKQGVWKTNWNLLLKEKG
jgi:hypothetical protein